jgi:hypothetical protein
MDNVQNWDSYKILSLWNSTDGQGQATIQSIPSHFIESSQLPYFYNAIGNIEIIHLF